MSTSAPPLPKKPAPPPLPKKPAPPPPKANGSQQANQVIGDFEIDEGLHVGPQVIVTYGPGGSGKTSLFGNISELGMKTILLDVEGGSESVDVRRIPSRNLTSFSAVRAALQKESLYEGVDVVGIDSLTRIEELAKAHVIATVPHEKDKKIEKIEDYGFGKGYGHIFDAMLLLLGDLDKHIRSGRHVVAICHDCTAKVPNPAGEDFLQYQPRLQDPDKSNLRLRVREWCDHLIYIGYDMAVKDGKAKGHGSRSLYVRETPTVMAKSRFLRDVIPYDEGSADFWRAVFRQS